MNIFVAIASAKELFQRGKALKASTLLSNTEAGAAALYAFLSALVTLLDSLGLPVTVGGSDLHTMANGWSITLALGYGIYRVATNPAAGATPRPPAE